MTKKEDEIIKFFKEKSFFKELNERETEIVLNVIHNYKDQKREVLILRIAQLIIKWDRFQVFY